ncbi:MAG: GAF domain-containing protein, partial [Anaerolineaceae bacterium]|nr:GAF domain-containing protein [Anaerolineaceae bacterium]
MKKINPTVKIIFLSLCSGLFFWVLDSVFQYFMFRDLLRKMIFTPPNNFLESLILQIPTYSLVNRIYVIIVSLLSGIALAFYINKQHKAQQELEDSEQQIQTLLDAMPDFICFKDGDGHWLKVNNVCAKIFQLEGIDYRGKKDAELAELNNQLQGTFLTCAETDARAWENGTLTGAEETISHPDGSTRVYDVTKVPIFHPGGKRKGLIVLGHDITRRKETEKAVRESEQNLNDLVEKLLDGVAIADENAYHIYTNPRFSEITGYSKEELQKITGWAFTRPEDRTLLQQKMKDRMAGKPVASRYDRIIVRKDGTEVPVEMSTTITTWQGKERPMAIIHDLTARVQAQEELKQYTRQLEVLRETSLSLTANLSLKVVLDVLLESALQLVSADDAHIYIYDGKELRFGAVRWTDNRQPVPFAEPRQNGLTYTVARRGEPIVVADMSQSPIFQDWPLEGAIIGLPLLHNEQVVGVMNVASNIAREFSESELHILYLLADQAAIAINNARLYEKVQQNVHQLETLNTVTAALSTTLELDKLLELIFDQIGQVLPFDSGSIFLYEGDSLRVVTDRGITPSLKGMLFPSEDNLFKETLKSQKPIILNQPKDDPRFKNWGQSKKAESWIGVPLIVRDTSIGFLTLDSSVPEAYSSEQVDLARIFASQAAQAIENARLYERVIADTNQLEERV